MTESPERRRLETRRAYAGRLINVDLDTVQAPDGSTWTLEMVRHPGAAAVVPLLSDPASADPQVLLIRQYRYAAGGPIWEVPAGVLEPGESPEECARRELREETGARAGRVEYLTTIYTTPGFTDERIHLFLATGITAGEPKPMSDEFIVVEAKPVSRVLEMIRDREIVDGKSIVALLYLAGFRLGL
ncbi:MAG: NUDIX hydrolase [Gemmatimonadetes bacterium]|nr:NUDIX hydrolase [Gemmatimonadota bacterium]MBI2404076.1 NUDIX hydrolase [Gemmatimonadota bacterium]MBI2535798.1 NUDIX hydrolase [Gemmatimonadota bacterium]MBI3081679.1 NUDIX hydrolase [Gemmatimonadota bacterium]